MNLSPKHTAADRLTLVTLSIGTQMLAIPAEALHEVLDPLPVTRVPGASEFSPHVLNVRGSVVPLADIGHALGLTRSADTDRRRIMVLDVSLDGDSATVVIEADAVHEVTSVPRADILPIPATMATWPPEYLHGLYNGPDGFVLLPDLEQIFTALTTRNNALPI
jgi:purine-binding chemotaxis protein CheW